MNNLFCAFCVVHQYEITPKAFANFSPGLERQRQPWDRGYSAHTTLKGFLSIETLSGFGRDFEFLPRVLANARTLG